MRVLPANVWLWPLTPSVWGRRHAERVSSLFAILSIVVVAAGPGVGTILAADPGAQAEAAADKRRAEGPAVRAGREILVAGYVSQPYYNRSDLHMTRTDGTDLRLKEMGWDGDALYFPIDGGIRSMEWWGGAGFMVDFLHNKAVSRLGRGAHGHKVSGRFVEDVAAEGTIGGKPAPPVVHLTDVFDRLEFTHGHNVLLFTPMLRLSEITPSIKPYVGIGAGFALPHVEIWFPGGLKKDRTSEYQFAGPAAQAVAGIELRTGKVSYFVEYKLSWASISAAITGDQSWLDFMMPGDLWRQFNRWRRGEEPKFGRFGTTLVAHQIAAGAGYWWRVR